MNEVKFKANIKDVLALQAEVAAIPEIPTPETTDEGKVLTVAVDSSGETPVVSYELETPSGGLPAISAGDAGKVLTVNAGETGAEWKTPSGGGSSDTYRILADSDYEHTITVPPTDAAALPTGAVWQVNPNTTFDHYLVDAEGTALTADDIQAVKIGDVILEQPADEYYDDSYTKSMVIGIMDYNGLDSDGNGQCLRFVYYSSLQGYGYGTVGYAFIYEVPIDAGNQ